MKICMEVSQKPKIELSYGPDMPHLGTHPKTLSQQTVEIVVMSLFIVVLFTVTKK